VTFAYYARLNRSQQAIYRQSDGITEVRLRRPDALRPLVDDLAAALAGESREQTQEATERLIQGLGAELGLPSVRVEVLAARPHARWGELHGLYTAERDRRPKIQLWMRTARQRRVVAFRTFLRTLLHELGHHIDYTLLQLRDSYHTEGFYKRESSLFHQLVPARVEAEGAPIAEGRMTVTRPVPDATEYMARPLEENLARMARTPDDLAAVIAGHGDAEITRRPDPKSWSARDVVCHLVDAEEYLMHRVQMSLLMVDPPIRPPEPDRWAEERQYARHDPAVALATFRQRREESLALLRSLTPERWRRTSRSPSRGSITVKDHAAILAWHDDNHLDQLARALEGTS
jgi:hypothetical protein